MNNKQPFKLIKLFSFTNLVGGCLLCLFIGSATIYPYLHALEIPLGYSLNSFVFCIIFGFFILFLFVLPCVWLFSKQIITTKCIIALSVLFILFLVACYWVPNYTMAKVSGLIVKKLNLGNRVEITTYNMQPDSCKLLKVENKYAKYYLFEDAENKICTLQNPYKLYTSKSYEQLLLLPTPQEKRCLIITLRRSNNSIRSMQYIDKVIVENILPDASFLDPVFMFPN